MSKLPGVHDVQILRFAQFKELVVAEAMKSVPFPIQRIFYVQGVPAGGLRGKHAHRECKQLLICQRGSVEVTVDDGRERRSFTLDSPELGLYLPAMLWAEQLYASEDTLLLVLTDQHFNEGDYLRDYAEFLAARGSA